ncbi:amidase [Mycobacterium manitobense]|uniref:Amidase n=2 Tax=[Mycobacterium] manitobense TaxID=190147 RepID=A0A9X3BT47_9MYCO|nr:amidase [[Mycobacterium] manitobense]
MITVTAQRARRESELSDERLRTGRPLSALDGLPIVWKDVFDVAGTVTTLGSASRRHGDAATADGALVRRASNLGTVTVGKTNLSEFAFSGLGINRAFGTPVNPIDPGLVPGGSSSGAAVAVATGIAPLAVGTDTSGSVRVPAAFTGCVGFRASFNRYGRNDFHPLSPALDTVGVIAKTVARILDFDRALASDADYVDSPKLRLVVPTGELIDECSDAVANAFAAAVDRLRGAGAVTTAEVPSLRQAQHLLDTHGTIVGADAYATYRRLLEQPQDIEPATRRRLVASARFEHTVDVVRKAMPALRRQFATELGGGLLLCPTVRHAPPRIADLLTSEQVYDAANASTLRTTMVLSYLGTCGISLPLGRSPIGMLLSAPFGHDRRLLTAAMTVQAAIE